MEPNRDIQMEIQRFLAQQGLDVSDDTSSPLELDSLTTILLLARLESNFKTEFESEDINLNNFASIDKIASLVESKIKGALSPQTS